MKITGFIYSVSSSQMAGILCTAVCVVKGEVLSSEGSKQLIEII